MVKDKLFLFCLIWLFSQASSCQVNTTDPQVSETIRSSKENAFFMRQYVLESSTDESIILEEAWAEKIWFYKIKNLRPVKVKYEKDVCQLCFKLKQVPGLKYTFRNYLDWKIKNSKTKAYVGVNGGENSVIYDLEFRGCNLPDTIELDLIHSKDEKSKITETKVGTLVFKAVEMK